QNSSKPFFSDVTGGLDQIDFNCILFGTQALQNRIATLPTVSREFLFCGFDEAILTGFGFHTLAVMFVGVKINTFSLGHYFKENFIEFRQPVNRFYSAYLKPLFFGQFFTFLHVNMFMGFAPKKHCAVIFSWRIWKKHKYGFLLVRTS